MSQLTFQGIVTKVQTTIDGGWRVYVDLSDSEAQAATELARMRDQVIQFAAIPTPSDGALDG